MGFIAKLLQQRSNLREPGDWLIEALIGGAETHAGKNVSEEEAMKYSAVYACVRVLAETVASLPLKVYERDGDAKYADNEHYLYHLLHTKPNPHTTSFGWREGAMAHLGLWGNAYAEKQFDGGGRVKALWPMHPARVKPYISERNGEKFYEVNVDPQNRWEEGNRRALPAERVLHIPGLSMNGIEGISPIAVARQAIGVGLAAEEFGARYFGSGTNIGGFVKHPEQLSDKAEASLRKSLEQYQGLSKSHRVMLLEEGMEFQSVGIPPEDSQFLETREFQVREIARIYHIPPHMIADLSDATYSNIEEQSLEFVVHTIRPWLVRWEQAINTSLFGATDRGRHFAEFSVDGLLRGDIESRYNAYATARQWGWMSANDVRQLENQNPLPDDQGDIYLVPMNMVPADMVEEEEPETEEQQARYRHTLKLRSASNRHRIANSYEGIIEDAADRIVKRETRAVRRAARKHLGERAMDTWEKWLSDFYNEFPDYIERQMNGPLEGLAEIIAEATADEVGADEPADLEEFRAKYAETLTVRHTNSSRGQIEDVVATAMDEEEDVIAALDERMDEWEERRPRKVAANESVQASNAFARTAFAAYGVTKLRWAAIGGDTCEFCQEMDGKVVGIEQNFLDRDDELDAEGREGNENINVFRPISHPPLHQFCVCQIIPD